MQVWLTTVAVASTLQQEAWLSLQTMAFSVVLNVVGMA
jgi:hypothetical protein